MTLNEEFLSYPSDRACKFLQSKGFWWEIYGAARSCKAVLDGDTWSPATYTEDGKIPDQNGVDIIMFPLIKDGEIINIIGWEPYKTDKVYLRNRDTNLWTVFDLIGVLSK